RRRASTAARPLWRPGGGANSWLRPMAAAVGLLLAALLAIPALGRLLGLEGAGLAGLAAIAVLLALCLAWLELLRLVIARLTARTVSAR
ncbi:MAG: hypothetical protein K8F35_01280, partial [Dokdonella sp.]|uniref:hypothetical protein n=1 Tax=Dokdonella sp. TaxID=2291710 RepID=UPI0025BB87DD